MKRIVTIQDISCVGKCSLTVALPILSCMGHETVPLPTAVLSNHTAFPEFTFRDLTEDLPSISCKWKHLDFSFDAIYSGYLGSLEQIDFVIQFIKDFQKENQIVVIDPVMADHGKFYTGFDLRFAAKMKELCSFADYILPNITEACFLLERPYQDSFTKEEYQDILKSLSKIGPKHVILTGISFQSSEIGAYAYDANCDEFTYISNNKLEQSFHGTGDIFASCFTGAIMTGKTMQDSLKLAVDFTLCSMEKTITDSSSNWYGVNFEEALPSLMSALHENYSLEVKKWKN